MEKVGYLRYDRHMMLVLQYRWNAHWTSCAVNPRVNRIFAKHQLINFGYLGCWEYSIGRLLHAK